MMDQFDGAFELLRDTFWAAVVGPGARRENKETDWGKPVGKEVW